MRLSLHDVLLQKAGLIKNKFIAIIEHEKYYV